MTQPLLSILIPTVVGRENQVEKLLKKIKSVYPWKEVKVNGGNCDYDLHLGECLGLPICFSVHKDDKYKTIGQKREEMYNQSIGLYSWQIDDDDDISDDAIERILGVITVANNIDCITFQEHINIDGRIEKSNHSLEYGDWEGEGGKELWDGFHYHRTPFMKSVIKTDIARSVPIPHIRFGEDHQWAQALKTHLKTEVHIPKNIYFYQHISTPFTERYGFDK